MLPAAARPLPLSAARGGRRALSAPRGLLSALCLKRGTRSLSGPPRYQDFLTPLSARREPSATRALVPLMAIPGVISLGTGLPNPEMFPFEGFSFSVRRPGGGEAEEVRLTPAETAQALQYGPTPGLPRLVAALEDMQRREHSPPRDGWAVTVTTGSQDALTRAFEMLVAPGESMLVEDPTYSGALAFLRPYGAVLRGVATDAQGILPEALEAAATAAGPGPRPRVLYTIPTGQNPGGSTASPERRRAVYEIACRHDLLIIEDDPYYFLAYGDGDAPPAGRDAEYRRPEARSYLSMDVEGRVLRMDSFSKILSSGLRLGVATGPAPLVERLNLHAQATSLHSSGLSQMVAARLLETWGAAGWDEHVRATSLFYMRRRDAFLRAADERLAGLAEWSRPSAGMFVWMRLLGESDTEELIMRRAVDAKVLMLPGRSFSPSDETGPHVRAAFSLASVPDMETALDRFAGLLKG